MRWVPSQISAALYICLRCDSSSQCSPSALTHHRILEKSITVPMIDLHTRGCPIITRHGPAMSSGLTQGIAPLGGERPACTLMPCGTDQANLAELGQSEVMMKGNGALRSLSR